MHRLPWPQLSLPIISPDYFGESNPLRWSLARVPQCEGASLARPLAAESQFSEGSPHQGTALFGGHRPTAAGPVFVAYEPRNHDAVFVSRFDFGFQFEIERSILRPCPFELPVVNAEVTGSRLWIFGTSRTGRFEGRPVAGFARRFGPEEVPVFVDEFDREPIF